MPVKLPVLALPALVLALAGCSAPSPPEVSGRAAGYHVLLITVDTLRADHLGCYGDGAARTPAIDALAAAGIRFDQATCAVPITLPSHATLMTGLDPPNHGVRLNGTYRLDTRHRTLAEFLQDAGYATGAAVGAFVLDERYGLAQGFSTYDDDLPPLAAADGHEYPERRADRVTDTAIGWLEAYLSAAPDQPFFYWAHYYDPHVPYHPPAPFDAEFAERPYDGEIAFVDSEIARLVAALERNGALERTLVVFAGDHGEGLGEHGEETHQDLIYDSTMRVPLIFSNRSLFGAGGVVADRVVGLVDVLPTLLDLLGLPRDGATSDGLNALAAPADTDRAVYLESLAGYLDYGWPPFHGLRRTGDKLIVGGQAEYYDLVEDPDELRNLVRTGRPEIAALERRLDRLRAEHASAEQARAAQRAPDAEELERLAALGYVRGRRPSASAAVDPQTMAEVAARVERAVELVGAGDAAQALPIIESVLAEHPDSSRALYVSTAIYDALGRYAEGEAALRRALELRPRTDGWIHLAWYAFQRSDWTVFEAALAEAERLDPTDGQVPLSRGHRHFQQGRYDEALAAYRQALEIDPERTGAEARRAIETLRRVTGR